MKRIKHLTLLAAISCSFIISADKVTQEDLVVLTGDQWKGKLSYLDYSSNKKTTIQANLLVSQSAVNNNIFYFSNEYPGEPHANNMDTLILSKDGKKLNEQQVIKKERIGNITKLITESFSAGTGTGKSFRYTYLIGKNLFSIKKEEKSSNDSAFFTRNIYEYQRK
jgi:hypothetical protein